LSSKGPVTRAWFLAGTAVLLLLAQPSGMAALDIGSSALEFEMTTVDGRHFSLAEAESSHRAVVVLFLSTLCPYSNYYNDLLRDMSTEFGGKGVLFLGINSSRVETLDEIIAHAREHGHTFPILRDAHGRLAALFDAHRTPEVFLLDHEGRLRYHGRIASKISSPDLKSALDSLLAGRPIHPAETKAFGCAIQRD
jgi:peroxiredoxin